MPEGMDLVRSHTWTVDSRRGEVKRQFEAQGCGIVQVPANRALGPARDPLFSLYSREDVYARCNRIPSREKSFSPCSGLVTSALVVGEDQLHYVVAATPHRELFISLHLARFANSMRTVESIDSGYGRRLWRSPLMLQQHLAGVRIRLDRYLGYSTDLAVWRIDCLYHLPDR